MRIILALLLVSSAYLGYSQTQSITSKEISLIDPPQNLLYSVNGSDVNLSWASPSSGSEVWLSYNDGSFENSFASNDGGLGLAQRFTLTSTPAILKKIRFATSDYQAWGKTLSVYVLGNYGSTVLGGPYIVNGLENAWITIETSIAINESHFMIATYNDEQFGPYVAVDDSYFDHSLFYGNHIAGFTDLSSLGDFEYVGSHEARVEYAKKSSRVVSEWIKPSGSGNQENIPIIHKESKVIISPCPGEVKALLGYNIYRDSQKINSSTWESTSYTDADLANDNYAYGVTAVYDEGESSMLGPVDVVVNNQGMPPPVNLTGNVIGNRVNLNWIGPGGSNEELIYDNGTATGAYTWPNFTLATHFSPSGPCQILMLKYLTMINYGGSDFHARIFEWTGISPGNFMWFKSNIQAIDGWVELDLSADNLMVDGEFVAGFASIDTLSFLAYDANYNNGRSWDYNGYIGSWSSWDQTYLIRAVVQYNDGTKEELGMEKGLKGYNVYRNNIKLNDNLVENTNFMDELPGWSEYTYNVTSVYDDSESVFSNDYSIDYYFGMSESQLINIEMYPNPTNGISYVRSSEDFERIKLYSINGQQLAQYDQPGNNLQIDVSKLKPGMYLVKVEAKEGIGVYKLLVR